MIDMGKNVKPAGRNEETLTAEQVKSMDALKRYLCSLAYVPGARGSKNVRVDACRNCDCKCGYGKEYVRRYDLQQEAEKMGTIKKSVDQMTTQEQLEAKIKECEELTKVNLNLAKRCEDLEERQRDAARKLTENHVEIEMYKMRVMRLKAKLYDMEHQEDPE